jgi:hypothetical protein
MNYFTKSETLIVILSIIAICCGLLSVIGSLLVIFGYINGEAQL